VVNLVEMLGDATIVTVELDRLEDAAGHQGDEMYVVSKMEPRNDLQAGQRVSLQVEAGKLHVFDPATGKNWVRRPTE
jgi:ABC-type sugar transport system ATPase subunit